MKEKRARRRPKLHGCRGVLLLSGIALLFVCSACSLYLFVPDIYYSFPVQKLLEDIHLVSNIFNRADKESDMIAFSCERGGGSSLYSVYPDGSNLRLLRESPSQAHVALDWSPDGIWIAFHTRVSPYYYSFSTHWTSEGIIPEIYRIRFDGSISKRLTYSDDWERIPKWSNDGKHIFYASGEHYSAGELRQISIHSGETRVIYDQSFWIYDLTSDGSMVALANLSNNPDVYLGNSDGSGLRLLKHLDSGVNGMQWSPDNRFLLYHASNGRPFVLNARSLEEVHAPAMRTSQAKWSPDSRRIAIVGEAGTYREGGKWHRTSDFEHDSDKQLHDFLYLLDFETGEIEQIIDDVNGSGLAWSPDGEWIAFSGSDYSLEGRNVGRLFKIKRDGTALQQLTDLDCRIREISWSPK